MNVDTLAKWIVLIGGFSGATFGVISLYHQLFTKPVERRIHSEVRVYEERVEKLEQAVELGRKERILIMKHMGINGNTRKSPGKD